MSSSVWHNLRNVVEFVSPRPSFQCWTDRAPNHYQLLLKEAAHIRWEIPSPNKQLKHAELIPMFQFDLYFDSFYILSSLILFLFLFALVCLCCARPSLPSIRTVTSKFTLTTSKHSQT